MVFTIVLVMTWTATQWTAWRLGFQPQLGAPWFELGNWPVYYPSAFFWWWFSFDAYAPAIFVEGAIIAASGCRSLVHVLYGLKEQSHCQQAKRGWHPLPCS